MTKRKSSVERPKFQLKKKKPNPDANAKTNVEMKPPVKISFEVGESIEFKADGSDVWTAGFLENTDPLQVVAENDPNKPIQVTAEQIRGIKVKYVEKKSAEKSESKPKKSSKKKRLAIKDMSIEDLRIALQDYQAKEKTQARYISVMQNKHDALQLKYDDAESDVDRLEKKLRNSQVDLREAKEDLNRARDKLEERDKELDAIEKEHEASTREVVDATIELDETKKRIKIQNDVIKQLSEKIGVLNAELQLQQACQKIDGYGPGAYTFVDGTIVRSDYSLESELVRQVEPGETVLVSQCMRHSLGGRHLIRGQINGGWVTLANLTGGIVFAAPVSEDYWRQQLQEKTSANQMLEMRNGQLADQLNQQTNAIREIDSLRESLQDLELKYNSLHTSYEELTQENNDLKDRSSQSSVQHSTQSENEAILKLTKELEDVNSVNLDLRNEIDVYRQDSDAHATIRNQRDLARDALKQRNEHFMNLQADYEKIRKDFDTFRDSVSRIKEDYDNAQEALILARRTEENHKQVIASYAQQLASVEDLRKKGQAAEATELKLKKYQRQNEQLNRQIDKMQRSVEKAKSMDRKLKAALLDYQKSQKDLAKANQSVVDLRKQIVIVKEKKEKYELAARKIKERWDKDKSASDNLRHEMSLAQARIKALEQQNEKLVKEKAPLEIELMQKKSELYELLNATPEKRVSDLQVLVQMRDETITKMKIEVTSLKTKNKLMDAELEDSSNELKNKQKKLNSMEIELDRLSKRETHLSERFQEMHDKFKEVKSLFNSMQKELGITKRELKEKTEILQEMEGHPEICNIGGISILEENQQLKMAQTEIGLLRQEVERLREAKPQKGYSSENENLRAKLMNMIRELQTAKTQCSELKVKNQELEKIAAKHKDQVGIYELQYQNKSLIAEKERLTKQIETQLQTIQKRDKEIQDNEKDIRDLNTELKKMNRESSQALSESKGKQKSLEEIQSKVMRLEQAKQIAADEVKRALQGKVASDRKLHEETERFRKDVREREEKHRKETRDLRERFEREMKMREDRHAREKKQISAKVVMNQFSGQQMHMMRASLDKTNRELKVKDQENRELKMRMMKLDGEANVLRNGLTAKQASVNGLSAKVRQLEARLKMSVGENLERATTERDKYMDIADERQKLIDKANRDKEALQKSVSSMSELAANDRKAAEMAMKLLEIAQETENSQTREIVLLQNHIEDLTKSLVIARKTSEKAEKIEEKSETLIKELTAKRQRVKHLQKRVRDLEHQSRSISGHFELHSRELTALKAKLQENEELILKKDAIILQQMKDSQQCRVKTKEAAEFEGKVISLQKTVSSMWSKLEEKTKLAHQKQEALKAQIIVIKKKEEELKHLRDTQAQLVKDKGSLSASVKTLQAQLEQQKRDISRCKEESEDTESTMSTINAQIRSQQKQIEVLQARVLNPVQSKIPVDHIPDGRVNIPLKIANQITFYIVELQGKVANLKEEVRILDGKLMEAIVSREKVERQSKASSDAAKSSNQELTDLRSYIEVVGQENESLKHQVCASKREIDTLEFEKRRLDKEIDSLNSRIIDLDSNQEDSVLEVESEESQVPPDVQQLKNELQEREAEIKKLNGEIQYLHRYCAVHAFSECKYV